MIQAPEALLCSFSNFEKFLRGIHSQYPSLEKHEIIKRNLFFVSGWVSLLPVSRYKIQLSIHPHFWTFQGCQRIVEDWQKILMVRSLVVSPHEDMRTWLKYASLCGKSGRLVSVLPPWCGGGWGGNAAPGPVLCLTWPLVLKALAHKTLVLLLGVDPSRQLDHPLPTVHPQVTYAYMKNMWKSARKVCTRLQQ